MLLPYARNAGLVGRGEEVSLVREPRNKYDRNAIQVKNIGGTQVCDHDDTCLSCAIERAKPIQVGHIPRTVAAKLAPLMDSGSITVEGVMHEGNCACSCIEGGVL